MNFMNKCISECHVNFYSMKFIFKLSSASGKICKIKKFNDVSDV